MTDRVKKYIEQSLSRDMNLSIATLNEIKKIKDFTGAEKVEMAGALSSLFFREYTKPEDTNKISSAVENTLAAFGTDITDWLIKELKESDPESAKHYAKILANAGNKPIKLALEILSSESEDPSVKANVIIAFGYCEDEHTLKALDTVIANVKTLTGHPRATAVQTLGRAIARLTNKINSQQRDDVFNAVTAAANDTFPKVRMQAIRTLGKMVRFSGLKDDQLDFAHNLFKAKLGMIDNNWDNAYIVRHEAETALHYCQSNQGNILNKKDSDNTYQQDYKIIMRRELTPGMIYFRIHAPLVAKKIEAGQFIIIRPDAKSERIPISIAGWDRDAGYLEIIIMAVGRTSREAVAKQVGDRFQDVVGPLGQRSHVKKYEGSCVVMGGGYGTGAVLPTARDLKKLGNRVIGVVGARNKDLLVMVDELKSVCDEVVITTNDGSLGTTGMVTDGLTQIMNKEKVEFVLAVGPVPMMKAISELTRPKNIETWVSLNAIMVDGTGMCGACRVTVGGKTRFACFHGPDFNGHQVDFEELVKRQRMFMALEKQAVEQMGV